MKILVICQYYHPEPFRINDICEELVNKGHDVTVVTGTPNYPMGEIYNGYENGKKSDETLNGVKIHRCPIAPRKTGAINRLINYYSYPYHSVKYINSLDSSFDVVFIYQLSPVMMAKAGIRYAEKHKKKSLLYCLDLWPASLGAGGINGGLIYNIFAKESEKIYKATDKIISTSKSFADYFEKEFNIKNTGYIPQYAENQFLSLPTAEKNGFFNLVFAGNLGAAQGVSTIISAAEILKDEKIIFHIVGDGIEFENLKAQAKNLENVIFYGRKPLEEMPKYYALADAFLVTLTKNPVISRTLPGKVQTYMAASKAIVGAVDGETALILEEAQGGFYGEAENPQALAENILKLKAAENIEEIGKKNREYYLNNFSKDLFINRICEELEGLI